MLIPVEGTYQDGMVRLDQHLAGLLQPAGKVLVVFLDAAPAGSRASGAGPVPRFSWDEELALSAGTNRVSVADEVVAGREERG